MQKTVTALVSDSSRRFEAALALEAEAASASSPQTLGKAGPSMRWR